MGSNLDEFDFPLVTDVPHRVAQAAGKKAAQNEKPTCQAFLAVGVYSYSLELAARFSQAPGRQRAGCNSGSNKQRKSGGTDPLLFQPNVNETNLSTSSLTFKKTLDAKIKLL